MFDSCNEDDYCASLDEILGHKPTPISEGRLRFSLKATERAWAYFLFYYFLGNTFRDFQENGVSLPPMTSSFCPCILAKDKDISEVFHLRKISGGKSLRGIEGLQDEIQVGGLVHVLSSEVSTASVLWLWVQFFSLLLALSFRDT